MAISRTTQTLLAKGDFDALEGEWLAHIDQDPTDLDYFVGVARALGGTGEEERARLLLELLDDQLRERELWAARLALLKRAASLLLPPDRIHPTIVATLNRLYGDRATYKALFEAAGLHRAPQDIPKTWEKVDKFESLLAFDLGTVVLMQGKGVGRVVEANVALESFKVDFERHRGLNVGFKAAPKLLQPLAPGHVMWRKLEEPATLKILSPPELLHLTLTSFGRPMTASEIRDALAGIVSESGWTSWWSAARKHPQVLASGAGARQSYRWTESSGEAVDALWAAFARSEPRRKIERLRRDGARDAALRDRMAADLASIAEREADRDPGLAFEIWFALERSGGASEEVSWNPDFLLAGPPDQPARLFAGIEERMLRERAYAMARERRDDWPELYRQAMGREQDPRALDLLADGLAKGSPRELERFLDALLASPHRQPAAFVWLAERASVDESFRTRNALRLLQQILTALGRDEFATYRVRLVALAESGNTLPRLIPHLNLDQAAQAEEAFYRAAALEPFQREQLIAALHLRFDALRKETGPAALYATRESIDAKRAELQQILSVEIPANRKAIEEARALGDLRENFEYKSARQRHEYLNARAASLSSELNRARPIDTEGMDASEVRIGTRVRLDGPAGGSRWITILGPWESRPEEDVLSYESDLGQAILGRKPGEEVSVSGEAWKVGAVEPFR